MPGMIKTHKLSDAQVAVLRGPRIWNADGSCALTSGRENTLAALRRLGILNGRLLTRVGNSARLSAENGERSVYVPKNGESETYYYTPAVPVADPHARCEHRKTVTFDHAQDCPVWTSGAEGRECTCHYSDARCDELTPAAPADAFDMANLTPAQITVMETNIGRVPEVIKAASMLANDMTNGGIAHRATYYTPGTTTLRADVDPAAYSSAVVNANDTARENGFDRYTAAWFASLDSTYAMAKEQNDTGRESAAWHAQQDAETAALALIPAYAQTWDADTLTVDGVAYAVTVNQALTHQHPREIMLTAYSTEHPAGFSFMCPRDTADPFNARFYNVARRDGGIDHPRTLADTVRLITGQLPSLRTPDAPADVVPDAFDDATHVIQFVGMDVTMCGELVRGKFTTLRVSTDPTDATCGQCLTAEAQLAAQDAEDGPTDDETHAAILAALEAAERHLEAAPVLTVTRTPKGKVRASVGGHSREFLASPASRAAVAMWAHTVGFQPVTGRAFKWSVGDDVTTAPARRI